MAYLLILVLATIFLLGVRWKTRWPWRKCWAFSFKAAAFLVAVALIGLWLVGVGLTLFERI